MIVYDVVGYGNCTLFNIFLQENPLLRTFYNLMQGNIDYAMPSFFIQN